MFFFFFSRGEFPDSCRRNSQMVEAIKHTPCNQHPFLLGYDVGMY